MSISNVRGTVGLNGILTPETQNAIGSVQIGMGNATLNLTDTVNLISFDALLVGATTALELDTGTLDQGAGTTAWVAGQAQITTATAAGTVTGTGNATVTVTSAGMTGSPLAISVAVTNGDTAAVWAGKVRAALEANATIAARFTVSGTSTSIILTRKPLSIYQIAGDTINVYPDDDATLNIALANDTSTGITAAPTSAATQAGIETEGVYAPDLDGKDFEGRDFDAIGDCFGLLVQTVSEEVGSNVTLTGDGFITGINIQTPSYFPLVSSVTPVLDSGEVLAFTADDTVLIRITIATE